jgi:2-polyprenyl-3-methyl-5-hydroxy-6-metoxy-1,4-benzoquinol methylase
MQLAYYPHVFHVNDVQQAMRIILTPEGSTTEERWKTETPYVAGLIQDALAITPETIIVDYGCGIGRMSKELIARHGCRVVGVDISPSMRALAVVYVQSDRFFACSPLMLDAMIERGFRFDAGISIWVLQHCHRPEDDVARLRKAIKTDGRLFILNNIYRAVPTTQNNEFKWTNDGADLKAMLTDEFALEKEGRLPPEQFPGLELTFWGDFRQRQAGR